MTVKLLSPPTISHSYIGESVRRREDERLLRGLGSYVDDIELDGALHIAFVRSDKAHATFETIESADALAQGAATVLTAADFPGHVIPGTREFAGMECHQIKQPLLADGAVYFQGQPIAAVVAETRARAEDLAELVRVNEEALPAAVHLRDAASSEENILIRFRAGSESVDSAFAEAALTVSKTVVIPRVVVAPMETRGALAVYDRGQDLLTVWCSAQDPHRQREQLAEALQRPEASIRIIIPDVGGAFGSKGIVSAEVAVTAFAAIKLGKPVRWTEDRLENFRGAPQGRGVEADVELALSSEGRILALRATILSDLGAFINPNSPNTGRTAAMLLSGVYSIPVSTVSVIGVRTNRVPIGVYRGAGRPEAAIIIEQLVEESARKLGIAPEELRRRNIIDPSAFPYKNGLGLTYDSGAYGELLDRVCELVDMPRRRERHTLERLEGKVVGMGIGMYLERSGGGWESAAIEIDPDGNAVVKIGSCPHGQGHETTFAQIVADALSLSMERIYIRWGDSSVVPRGVGTFGSRSIAMGGSAAHLAAQRLKFKLLQIAAYTLNVAVDDLTVNNGVITTATGKFLTFQDIAERAYEPSKLPESMPLDLSVTEVFSAQYSFSSGAYFADIEIDRNTGHLSVRQLIALDDPGRVINPLLAEGQVLGGIAQGLGEALMEEAHVDDTGQPLSVSFMEYGIFGESDMPAVQAEFFESPSPLSPIGAKGVGEGGACGAPAALCNAVFDALAAHGGHSLNMPFAPEKLWAALHPVKVAS